jgi:electron transfer flavoprotein beta subunit
MRIAVCLKQVVTPETRVRPGANGTWIREDAASWALGEADRYALEEGLRLKERHGGEVIAISAGPARCAQILRDALARGADRAIHVQGDHLATSEAAVTAASLAEALAPEQVNLVLTGLQSDDQGFGQVGVVLAELLGVAHATLVVAIEVHASRLRVKRELEAGWFQWVGMPTPAVLTVQSGMSPLRHATLKGIMAAKKKELRVVAAAPPAATSQRIVSLRVPAAAKQVRLIEGPPAEAAAELVRALRDDARVI